MVEYSVIVNDADMNTDDVQDIMLGLCYNHQIVSRAVSIPGTTARKKLMLNTEL